MPVVRITNTGGQNTFLNPLVKSDAELIYSLNVESYPFGAKRRREGYSTFLGTSDGSTVSSLFSWTKNNGSLILYRASGSKLYYSLDGTAAWAVANNGTISAGARIGHTVLNDTLIIGDAVGSTRHTTSGTTFVNTTLAPVGQYFTQYQNRVYLGGTASTLFYSTTGNAADWDTAGTSDSSSLSIPGEGKIRSVFTAADRVVTTKDNGNMIKWDGFSQVDMATEMGPTSPYSIAEVEGFFFWLNRFGLYGFGGGRPELLSNAVQAQIFNDAGTGISGSTFDTAPGDTHYYDYFTAIGNVTDDVTAQTTADTVLKYDFQKNEFLNYKYANFPSAIHSYTDKDGAKQMIFGSSGGQVYKTAGTDLTDAGNPIESHMEYFIHMNAPDINKKFNVFRGFFNPGCEATVQVAVADTFSRVNLNWTTLGDAVNGVVRYRFPQGEGHGKFLYVKITDNDTNERFRFYGMTIDFEPGGIE